MLRFARAKREHLGPLEPSYATLARMARKQVIVQLDDDLVAELDASAAADEWEREADRRYAASYREHPDGWQWDDQYARMAKEAESDSGG